MEGPGPTPARSHSRGVSMLARLALLLALVAGPALVAAPSRPVPRAAPLPESVLDEIGPYPLLPPAERLARLWGAPVDRGGECTFAVRGTRLRVRTPGESDRGEWVADGTHPMTA